MKRIGIFIVIAIVIAVAASGGLFWYAQKKLAERRQRQMLDAEARKKVQEQIKVTFIEGLTNKQMLEVLRNKYDVNVADNFFNLGLALRSDTITDSFSFLKNVDLNKKDESAILEGFLFPDTYLFNKPISPYDVVDRMLVNFGKRLAQAEAASGNGGRDGVYSLTDYPNLTLGKSAGKISLYQILTLASIIEKETGRDVSKAGEDQKQRLETERRTIAGIFYNRLVIGQALQSDATVNYATGKSDAQATFKDLETDSPYNTYKYAGLPPGPICNPSLASIIAALDPIKTDYYYFFHKQPSGEVVYSKTFEEHSRQRARFLP